MARGAMPGRVVLERAPIAEDFAGVDVHYIVNHHCSLAVRVRKNRPAYAADIDVTFRNTEPHKIAAETYAPLMLFVWLNKGFAKAGKLIDVYRMARRITPPLAERRIKWNRPRDGTGWVEVTIPELVQAGALLRQGDRDAWAAACLGGNERARRIIDKAP